MLKSSTGWCFIFLVCTSLLCIMAADIFPGQDKDCILSLTKKHLDDKAPLFLYYKPSENTTSSQLYLPKSVSLFDVTPRRVNYIQVKNDAIVMLACPGTGNVIQGSKSQVSIIACRERKFSEGQKNIKTKNLKCKSDMEVNVEKIGQCGVGDKFDKYKVGYQVKPEKIDETILEVCFDPTTLSTSYTKHVLRGSTLKSAATKKPAKDIKNVEKVYGNVNPEVLYKKKSQRKMFERYMSDKEFKRYFDGNGFTRTQLTPRKDFPMKAWRKAADLYLNVVPHWKSISRGHWTKLEEDIRNLAIEKNMDLEVISGILIDDNSTSSSQTAPSYLDPNANKVIIPDFIYKIIIDKNSTKGIAFVNDNSPAQVNSKICKDICTANQWPSYKQNYKGVIYCCEVNELVALLRKSPDVRVSGGVLKGSESLSLPDEELGINTGDIVGQLTTRARPNDDDVIF